MKTKITLMILGLLLLIIFLLTFMKSPEAITSNLKYISNDIQNYSVLVHILFFVVIVWGLLVEKIRNALFSLFLAFISLSATIISVRYLILPNIILE